MALTKGDKGYIKSLIQDSKTEILDAQDKKFVSIKNEILEEQDRKFTNIKDEILEEQDKKFTQFKSDFFERIDPILKEVLASSEERSIVAHNVSDLRDRIEKIEKHLGFPA